MNEADVEIVFPFSTHRYEYPPEPPEAVNEKVSVAPVSIWGYVAFADIDGTEFTVIFRDDTAVNPSASFMLTSIEYVPEEVN